MCSSTEVLETMTSSMYGCTRLSPASTVCMRRVKWPGAPALPWGQRSHS